MVKLREYIEKRISWTRFWGLLIMFGVPFYISESTYYGFYEEWQLPLLILAFILGLTLASLKEK